MQLIGNFYDFPIKFVEYILTNTPTFVAGKNYQINNYLIQGNNAIVIKTNDVSAMANAVLKLLNDLELFLNSANNSIETVKTSFHNKNYIDRYGRFYKTVVFE
jgi:glycosyltransferase involved in cell wall biosynthesis